MRGHAGVQSVQPPAGSGAGRVGAAGKEEEKNPLVWVTAGDLVEPVLFEN